MVVVTISEADKRVTYGDGRSITASSAIQDDHDVLGAEGVQSQRIYHDGHNELGLQVQDGQLYIQQVGFGCFFLKNKSFFIAVSPDSTGSIFISVLCSDDLTSTRILLSLY